MHRFTTSLIGLGLLLATLVFRPASGGTLDRAGIRETVFPSGLRLIVKESDAADLASVQVWIRAGGFLETQQTAGTAHVIEHLLFKGTETSAPGALDDEIENLGGLLEASTEKDYTRLACTVAGRYAPRVLQAIAGVLRKPALRQQDLDDERHVLLEEAAQSVLEPDAHVTSLLFAGSFGKHPYRWDVRGTREFLNGLKIEQVREYFRMHYTARNTVIVVVGNVDGTQLQRVVQGAFATAPEPSAPPPAPLPDDEFAGAAPVRRELSVPFTNGYVGLAYPAPSVRDQPDVHAMDVILTLLEHDGTGRLPRLLKGDGVQAVFETRRQAGLFLVTALARGGVEPLEAALRKELAFLAQQPVPAAELSLAKRQLRGGYILDAETFRGQAGTLGYYAAIDRWEFASEYLAKIEAVTAEQVQEIARKYLRDDRCSVVLMRPMNAPPPRPRGDVTCGAEQPDPESAPCMAPAPPARPAPAARPVAAPVALPPARKRAPVSVATLSNGLRLLCRRNSSSELVSIVCQVRAGLPQEREEQGGIAALTGETIVRGSSLFPGESYPNAVVAAGAVPRIMPGYDLTEFSIVAGREQFEASLKLLSAVLAHPRIEKATVDQAREALKARYLSLRDDYTGASYQALLNQLHPGGPYGRPMTGYPKVLDRFTVADVQRFYEEHYSQNRMVVAIVGDVDPSAALTLAQKQFADLPFRPGGPALSQRPETLPAPGVEAIRREGPAAQVMIGFPAPAVTLENYAVHAVLDAVIGGGKRGRLFRSVREKRKFGYEQGSFYQPLGLRSHQVAYVITPQYQPDPKTDVPGLTLEPVRSVIFQQFKELAETGPTPEELTRAVAFLVGRYALRAERNRDQAHWLAWYEAMGLGKDFEEQLPARAAAVTAEQVKLAAERMLATHAVVVTLPADD